MVPSENAVEVDNSGAHNTVQRKVLKHYMSLVSVLTDGVSVKEPDWSSEDCQEHFVVEVPRCIQTH